jgi:hypothetical protein
MLNLCYLAFCVKVIEKRFIFVAIPLICYPLGLGNQMISSSYSFKAFVSSLRQGKASLKMILDANQGGEYAFGVKYSRYLIWSAS